MKRVISFLSVTLTTLTILIMAGCGDSAIPFNATSEQSSSSSKTIRPEGWTEETHSNNVDPDYDVVFPRNKVNQITITIAPDDWGIMQANITELLGAPGTGQQDVQPGDPGVRPDRGDVFPDDGLQDDITAPRAPGLPGWINTSDDNPTWVPATVEFDGLIWTNVGVRYKGNSSLRSGWRSGTLKLPLKLDFDEFEDEYPEIDNQRFYGFKQLSFSTAFNDRTYMHDMLAANIMKESELPAAETAYYEVIMDYGEGPVNLGLYVMIEVIDDTVIESYFGDDSGNIYEGDGRGVSLAEGNFSQIKSSFLKENNEDEADWGDIEELYNVLHSEERISDPEAWRKNLESIFDVDVFLEWLAISSIIQHWDTYGSMTHNFYIYHDPDTGLLTWISWDHNEVLAGSRGIDERDGRFAAGARVRRSVSISRDEVTRQWPLIRYLLDDPVYYELYTEYIEATINGAFNPDKLEEKCHNLAELIRPYIADSDITAFELAVKQLINSIHERFEVATTFLASGS